MTVKELSQLYYLNREIESLQERLADIEAQAAKVSAPALTGMPGGGEKGSRVERYAAEIVDLKAIISAKQIECIHERSRLERWINAIPDSITRQIFALRFINGLPWHQVAAHLGGGNSENGVRMRCYRYLKETEEN